MKIVVVGAGIAGACAANFLLRDGHQVLLLDANEPGSGCSFGNAGSISIGSCTPLSMPGTLSEIPGWIFDPLGPLHIRARYLPKVLPWLLRFVAAGRASGIDAKADALRALNGRGVALYTELLDGDGDGLIRVSGVLQAYRSEKRLEGSTDWNIRAARGVRQRVLDAGELHDLVPALAPDFRQGLLLPEHGFISAPGSLVELLVRKFAADGGEVVRARVKALLRDGSGAVTGVATTHGDIAADAVAICAGAWSMHLLAGTGLRIPLETQRGYHSVAIDPSVKLPLPVVDSEAKVYASPMRDGLRFAGTVEFAGLDAAPDYRRAEANLTLGQAMFPGLEYSGVSEWMGHRPCLPDSIPVVGPAPGIPGLYLNFGHGHYGMTASPASGALLAALVTGRPAPVDPTPYRADRF